MRQQLPLLLAASLALALAVGCRAEPAPASVVASAEVSPGPHGAPSAQPARAPAAGPAAAEPQPAASSLAVAAAASSAPAASAQALSSAQDLPLVGPDGAPLPQTDERPSLSSERFQRRVRELAESILTGDVERGRSSFFPLLAYAQVKDVQKPERDYRYRLMAHFERDVREYARELRALGKGAERAQFLGIEVPEERVQWMKPGKEGNRLGYFRVLRSRLRFRLEGGAEKTFELTSMISWRGEWYVVHLHGFE